MNDFRGAERPASVLLVGGFGHGDPAQESLLEAFLAALPEAEVTIASHDPRATIAQHAVPAVSSDSLPQLLTATGRASAVVFAGGTPFTTRGRHDAAGPSPLRTATAIASLARTLGSSVLAFGVASGALPTRSARMLGREFARRSDLLVLRDSESARLLIEAGVPAPMRVGADPTWILADRWPLPADAAEDAVVIVPDAASAGGDFPLDAVLAALRADGLAVRVDPWGEPLAPDPDVQFAQRLAARVPGVDVAGPPRDLAEAATRLVGARLVIALRLHAQIAAAVAGVPCLGVVQEPDQAALANRLGQPWISPTAGAAELTAAVRGAIGAPPASAAAVKAEMIAAQAGFDLVRLMLGDAAQTASLDGLRLEPGS